MHASSRRQRHGAFALALLGIFSLLAAFVPGVAGADEDPNVLPLSNGAPGASWSDFEQEDCVGDLETYDVQPGEYLWHVVSNPQGESYIDLYVPAWGISGMAGSQAGNGGYHWWIVNTESELPAGPFSETFYVETDGTSPGGQNIRISHACEGGEGETFEVIPDKVWVGEVPAGATATIAVQVEGETVKSFTFDDEGNLVGEGDELDPVELDEGTVYTIVETNVFSPAGWECVEVEVAEPADDTIYNECEEDDTPGTLFVPPVNQPEPPASVGGVIQENIVDQGTASAGDELVEQAAAPQTLPRTGATSLPLAAGGALSLLSGLGLARMSRRED